MSDPPGCRKTLTSGATSERSPDRSDMVGAEAPSLYAVIFDRATTVTTGEVRRKSITTSLLRVF